MIISKYVPVLGSRRSALVYKTFPFVLGMKLLICVLYEVPREGSGHQPPPLPKLLKAEITSCVVMSLFTAAPVLQLVIVTDVRAVI